MSKYFDQTRRAADRDQAPFTTKRDVQDLLEVVAKAGGVTRNVPAGSLAKCRKIRLPQHSGSLLISTGSDTTAIALEGYRALRTRMLRAQGTQAGRSFIVTSAMAGEGKTLTALNLGLCCAQLHDCRVLVIDSDLRTSGLSRLVGDPEGIGLSDVLKGKVEYGDAIVATDNPNLFILPAGVSDGAGLELFAGNRWKDLIAWCGTAFQLVLVDSPPILPVADFEQIVSSCDNVLMVVRALKTERDLLRKAVERIDSKKMLGAVFNGSSSDYQGYPYYNSRRAAHTLPSISTVTNGAVILAE